jgi:hypothetical protein
VFRESRVTTSQTTENAFLQGSQFLAPTQSPRHRWASAPEETLLAFFPQTVQSKRTAYKSPPTGDDLRPSLLHCFALKG